MATPTWTVFTGRVLAGINLLDTATHTWDLATATGHPTALLVAYLGRQP